MKILVCIKQVPHVDQLIFDHATKRLVRDGVENEINPFDRRAITAAVNLRDQFGGDVTVLTMGPPQARDALVEALAMGCDHAVHLLGREFAGADTLATAHTLAAACRKLGFDLILCGKYSTDAETAQVPPMLAELLDLPQVTGVTRLQVGEDRRHLTAVRETDDGFATIEGPLPALLSASERLVRPIRVKPEDVQMAQQKPITVWGAADLAHDTSKFGLAGSPTWVAEIHSIQPNRKRIIRTTDSGVEAAVRDTVRDLLDEGLFATWKTRVGHIIRPRSTKGAQDRAIWVVAETVDGSIRSVTLELLGRGIELAEAINGELAAVLIGANVASHAHTLAAYGADRVYLADDPALATYSTEAYTAVLAEAIRLHNPYAVLVPSTANGRDLAPRVAARLSLGLTGDCIGLDIDSQQRLVQMKPAFGGNIVAPILSKTRPAMATVRPGMLQSAVPDFSRQAIIEHLPTAGLPEERARTVGVERSASVGLHLESAQVVIGVGMGIGGPHNLPLIQELATTLDAAIGASRRAVDEGWLPRQVQIGLTGRAISPQLYIAVGVSGKFNHTVGIQRAGLVLAINSDANAPIFRQCDYGIVGDWMTVVSSLVPALREARQRKTEGSAGGGHA